MKAKRIRSFTEQDILNAYKAGFLSSDKIKEYYDYSSNPMKRLSLHANHYLNERKENYKFKKNDEE